MYFARWARGFGFTRPRTITRNGLHLEGVRRHPTSITAPKTSVCAQDQHAVRDSCGPSRAYARGDRTIPLLLCNDALRLRHDRMKHGFSILRQHAAACIVLAKERNITSNKSRLEHCRGGFSSSHSLPALASSTPGIDIRRQYYYSPLLFAMRSEVPYQCSYVFPIF